MGFTNTLYEKRWALAAIFLGIIVGFVSAYLCIIWHLVIFGFNIMYIVSPLAAGFVETVIARRKYGKSTGAISALSTFLLINIYGWFLPGTLVQPNKEPATLSLITIIAIILTIQAAFPILMNYILTVTVVGIARNIIGFLVFLPSRIRRRPRKTDVVEQISGPTDDEIFLDGLDVPLLSVPQVAEGKIKTNVGLVTGEAVAEENEVTGRLEKLTNIIEPKGLDDFNFADARKTAIARMFENAKTIGADGVIDVLIDYVTMGGIAGGALLVTATGTAVIYEEK